MFSCIFSFLRRLIYIFEVFIFLRLTLFSFHRYKYLSFHIFFPAHFFPLITFASPWSPPHYYHVCLGTLPHKSFQYIFPLPCPYETPTSFPSAAWVCLSLVHLLHFLNFPKLVQLGSRTAPPHILTLFLKGSGRAFTEELRGKSRVKEGKERF